jgi:hypothetical protein
MKINKLQEKIMNESIAEQIRENQKNIEAHLKLGVGDWDDLLDRIERQEVGSARPTLNDEQLWTFLLACGYAAAKAAGVQSLTEQLTKQKCHDSNGTTIYCEVLPSPPRKGEGSTHLDLALGHIQERDNTKSGIKPRGEASWICFCEMKWYSDIAADVTADVHRNQLARVIENALTFGGQTPSSIEIYVTLVTPKVFSPDASVKSRLYQYKFQDYVTSNSLPKSLQADLAKCSLTRRDGYYPDDLTMESRMRRLRLNWVSYDELFEQMPNSVISEGIKHFWEIHGGYQGRRIYRNANEANSLR